MAILPCCTCVFQAIKSTAASLGMPPLALFAGYLIIISFAMSHSKVYVEGTDLVEPVLIWLLDQESHHFGLI